MLSFRDPCNLSVAQLKKCFKQVLRSTLEKPLDKVTLSFENTFSYSDAQIWKLIELDSRTAQETRGARATHSLKKTHC